MKSILVSLTYPIFLAFFQRMPLHDELSADPLMSVIIAGVTMGLGSALILIENGSGGGFDILAVIMHKKWNTSIPLVMYLFSASIIIMQAFSTGSIMKTLYGILASLTSNLTVHYVLSVRKSISQILVVSPHYEEIRTELCSRLDAGVTLLNGESGLLRNPTKVILTVVPHDKLEDVKRCIIKIDPTAFLLEDSVHYVGGRGYTLER